MGKLVTNAVDPKLPSGVAPGSTKLLRVAIDMEGKSIERIDGERPAALGGPCAEALKQWKFHPIMENGQPRPYRANIVCRPH